MRHVDVLLLRTASGRHLDELVDLFLHVFCPLVLGDALPVAGYLEFLDFLSAAHHRHVRSLVEPDVEVHAHRPPAGLVAEVEEILLVVAPLDLHVDHGLFLDGVLPPVAAFGEILARAVVQVLLVVLELRLGHGAFVHLAQRIVILLLHPNNRLRIDFLRLGQRVQSVQSGFFLFEALNQLLRVLRLEILGVYVGDARLSRGGLRIPLP